MRLPVHRIVAGFRTPACLVIFRAAFWALPPSPQPYPLGLHGSPLAFSARTITPPATGEVLAGGYCDDVVAAAVPVTENFLPLCERHGSLPLAFSAFTVAPPAEHALLGVWRDSGGAAAAAVTVDRPLHRHRQLKSGHCSTLHSPQSLHTLCAHIWSSSWFTGLHGTADRGVHVPCHKTCTPPRAAPSYLLVSSSIMYRIALRALKTLADCPWCSFPRTLTFHVPSL